MSENELSPKNPESEDTSAANADEALFVENLQEEAQEQPKEEPKVPKEKEDDSNQRPKWYIVHTYSGFEQRVQKTINELKRTGQDKGLIYEVIVPTEKVIEVAKGGQKRTITRKSYPGYVLVRMIMTDLSWHLVQSIPKVTGFIGGKNRPAPMRDSEAQHILDQMQSSIETPKPKFSYEVGEEVKVTDGPFGGFNAVVQEVNYDKGKLTVAVSIFGRQTPMELDFSQVTRP
ncbi:MAG: transcription termination/antitermination protein NusG [Desulfovibrionaceae bacterium]|nr:transcription termination/antitermination protein NusG [Desulfovibrionaceae bacterium]